MSANKEHKGWMIRARLEFKPGAKEPCSNCGRYKSIAQAHHIYPLRLQYGFGLAEAEHSYVWLCPTHHVAAHLMIEAFVKKRQFDLFGFPASETDALDRVMEMFGRCYVRCSA